MSSNPENAVHDATASAMGFRYQERYALIELLNAKDEEATVAIESLDDVHLKANGVDILEQLKHSFATKLKPIDIKSVNLWTTLRIWSELLPDIDISCTSFVLVTVAPLTDSSSLECLQNEGSNRAKLRAELIEEAERIVREVLAAESAVTAKPHAKKSPGARAFLALSDADKEALIEKVSIRSNAPNIGELEDILATRLNTYPASQRVTLSRKTYEWWDRQILLSFEQKRERFIARHELLEYLSETSSALHTESLMDSFSSKQPPTVFHTNEMLVKQCDLVNAKPAMSKLARISEWQARNQRSEWSIEAPSKHSKIVEYDERLVMEWKYKHDTACENADSNDEESLRSEGHEVLKWTLEDAPTTVGSIESTITSPFYVRGSYQVLAIQGRVGWHPQFRTRLEFKEWS